MNAETMIESGTDPLMLVCEHAKKRGFQFLAHILLNMNHTSHGRVTNCRVADFTTAHPEWQVGPEPDFPEAEFDSPSRLSYSHPEVRADRLAVIRELVSDYPSDGVEMNLDDYTPLIGRSEIEEHTDTLTEWMREIRQACDAAAAQQGRAKRLVVRMPGTLHGSKSIGLDLERWIREEIVDTVIAMPVRGGWENDTALLREIVEVAEGTGVKGARGTCQQPGTGVASYRLRRSRERLRRGSARGAVSHVLSRPEAVPVRLRDDGPHPVHGLSRNSGPHGQDLPAYDVRLAKFDWQVRRTRRPASRRAGRGRAGPGGDARRLGRPCGQSGRRGAVALRTARAPGPANAHGRGGGLLE